MDSPRRWLSLIGLGLIAIGTQLSWLVVDLTTAGITNFSEMPEIGLGSEVWGLIGLPVSLLVFIGVWRRMEIIGQVTVVVTVGLVAALIALVELASYPSLGGTFAPGIGVYTTLIGGLLVLGATCPTVLERIQQFVVATVTTR